MSSGPSEQESNKKGAIDMSLRLRLTIAALVVAGAIPFIARPAATAASSFQISKVTLTSSSARSVGTASSLCATTFNYLIANVTVPLTMGATLLVTPPGGSTQVIARTSDSSPNIA